MAQAKQKPAENPDEKKPLSSAGNVPEKKAVSSDEKTSAVEKKAKEDVAKETSGMKREVLQMKVDPDKDTTTKINNLDIHKGLETAEQKLGFELLEFVTSTTLLASIFKSGTNPELLKKIENIKDIKISSLAGINATEQAALKKLQEIASSSSRDPKSLGATVKERWGTLVDRASEIYGTAEKGITGRVKEFVTKNPKITAMIAIAGACGIAYGLYRWFSKPDNDKKSVMDTILGDKWSKRLKYGLGLGMVIFVMGKLAGNKDIREKLGINITGNRLTQVAILMSEGKFAEAAKVLVEGPDEEYESHQKMAEKISQATSVNVQPETLKQMGKIKYDDFMSIVSKGMSAIPGLMSQVPWLKDVPGVNGKVQAGTEEQAVRKYFEAHQDIINHFKNGTTTVDDVLKKLQEDQKAPAEAQAPAALAIEKAASKIDDPQKKQMVEEIVKDLAKIIPAASMMKIITEGKKNHIDTQKVEEAWAQQKAAYAELQSAIENNSETKVIAEKAGKLFELNERLGNESNSAMDEIMSRHGWTETQLLAATHLPKFTAWFRQPKWKKEYGKYLIEKYLKIPVGLAQKGIDKAKGVTKTDLIGKEFRTGATPAEIEQDLTNTKKELEEAKKILTETEAQLVTKADDEIKREVAHAKSRVAVLESDVKINESRKTIADLEQKLADLKTKGGTTPAEIAQAEKALEENRSILQNHKRQRLKSQANFLVYEIADRKQTFIKEFGTDGKKAVLSKTYIEQMDTLQERVALHRKQVDLEIANKIAEAEKLSKEGKDLKVVFEEVNELRRTKLIIDIGSIDAYQKLAKSWKNSWNLYHAMMGSGSTENIEKVMKEEKNDMQRLWIKMMGAQPDAAKTASGGVIHTMKGKLLFYLPFMAVGSAINLADQRESENWSKAIEQAGADTLPFISTYSDFYSAAKGEELVTKRKLDTKDRAIRALFGTGSVLCDATEFAGVFMRIRAASGAFKEAKAIDKSISLGQLLKEGRPIDNVEALRDMEKTGHWINKVAMGSALGAVTASVFYLPAASMEILPETKEILGNLLEETDVQPPKIDHPLAA